MELKVWVDGLPRVVCGVSSSTSCQEVVRALAQALGRTGRFTLVEQWRDVERLLAPSDCPLRLLHKWGEYANDVRFILRHSDGRSRSDRTDRRVKNASQVYRPSSASAAVKRSLTFAAAHAGSPSVQERGELSLAPSQPTSITAPQHVEYSSLERKPPLKMTLSAPLMDRRSPFRGSIGGNPSLSGSQGSLQDHRSFSTNNTPMNSLDRRRRTPHVSPVARVQPEVKAPSNPVARVAPSSAQKIEDLKDENANEHNCEKKEELVKLVNLQIEKLQLQEQCLGKLQTEIQTFEEEDAQLEKETGQLSQEISHLEQQEMQLGAQLEDMEWVSWEDKVQHEEQRSAKLRQELSFYQKQVEQFEQQLKETREKLSHLSQELENNAAREEEKKREREREEREMRIEIEELQKLLEAKEQESASTQNSLSLIEKELKNLDESISKQKAQIEQLEEDLRETNLDQFAHSNPSDAMVRLSKERRSASGLLIPTKMSPAPPASSSSSSSSPASVTPARSPMGRIFNADTLKEAVATTSDSDTLWV